METIGSYLRQQREKAGISLEQISVTTKIRPSLLRNLERDQLDDLPGGVFVRGFVKAYGEAVGTSLERPLEILETQIRPCELEVLSPVAMEEDEPSERRFKVAHLLVLVLALLTMLGAYYLTSGQTPERAAVTSAQSTDVDSGTTRSFSPLSNRQ